MADSDSSESDSSADLETRNVKRKSSADSSPNRPRDDDDETPPKKPRIGFSMMKKVNSRDDSGKSKMSAPICLKLGSQKPKEAPNVVKSSSASVAKAFNADEDEDSEEMPPEAKMRMRNIGRETPTSAGPNSFGKTRQGFCDTKKMFERQIKKKLDAPE